MKAGPLVRSDLFYRLLEQSQHNANDPMWFCAKTGQCIDIGPGLDFENLKAAIKGW